MSLNNNIGLFCAKTHIFTRDTNDVFAYLLGHPEVEEVKLGSDSVFVNSSHSSETQYYEFLNLLRAKFIISNFKQEK